MKAELHEIGRSLGATYGERGDRGRVSPRPKRDTGRASLRERVGESAGGFVPLAAVAACAAALVAAIAVVIMARA